MRLIKQALPLAAVIAFTGCGGSGGGASDENNSVVDSEQQEVAGQGVIRVLSNRPDLINGGDALVEVASANLKGARIQLNGKDISDSLTTMDNGVLRGLITGLELGENELKVILGKGGVLRKTIINHPKGGPVFSGPQVQPWNCTNENPVDDKCNQPAEFEFKYVPQSQFVCRKL